MAQRPIDEKIVVMNLENSEFKRKAAETTSIFGKLKSIFSKSGDTNLNKVTKELGNVKKAANSVDMSQMARSVDMVASRFSTLGIVATTALTNITNKAVNAGLQLQKSLTTDQVMDGFKEYELKMGSIQTMLSNTEWEGSSLDDVKNVLGELNEYADRTIYDFGQMTQSIGKWTAAGVGLKDSAIAIKGMGNLAASSGASVEQLNSAMYQMSQAMSAGKFGAIDWISLDNAGMGGKKTKDALMAVAKEMGKTIDLTDGFKGSLQDGWLTAEVFLETMKRFGSDESMTEAAQSVRTFTGMMAALKEGIGSGWAETWELIFGDFEQATRLWTAVSNVVSGFFQKQTDARNNFIKGAIDSGAVEKLGQVVMNIGTPIVQLFKAIGSAFKSAFPPVESTGLVSFLSTIANLTTNLKMNASTVENIKTIFQGLFSIVGIGVEVFKILVGAVLGLIPGFDGAGGGITAFIANFAKIPTAIYEYLKTGDLAEKITEKLRAVFSGLGSILSVVGAAFMGMASFVGQAMSILSTGNMTDGILKQDSKVVSALLAIRDGFEGAFGYISSIDFGAIGAGIMSFFDGIGNTFEWVMAKFKAVADFFKGFFPMIADNQGWILAGGGLAATGAIIWKVYETFKSIMDIGGNFAETLEGVSDALGAFTLGIHARSLFTIALAVGVLAVSLSLLARLDGKQIATSLTAVVVSLTALVGALFVINKAEMDVDMKSIASIVALSVAVSIMASAVSKLGELDMGQATQGVIALTALLGALSGALVLMTKFGGTFTVSAAQFLGLAAAIGILSLAINQLSDMDPGKIVKGVSTIGVLLAEMAIFIKVASTRSTTLAAGAAGILATSAAIIVMVQAIENISDIQPANIVKGLVTIGALLTAIGGFTVVVNDKQLLATGAGLLLLAGAINALVLPIVALGNTPLGVLATGLGAIAIALAAFAATSRFMVSIIPAAIAIGILAGALHLLIIPIAALGQMSWQTILTGIGGLALGLLAFGGVAAILGVVSPALVLFSVAIAAVGVGFLALGTGMKLLATGLITLSALTVGAVGVMVSAFGAFITGITALLPAITDLVMKVMLAVTDVMVKMAPKVAEAVGKLIVAVLAQINEYTPQILDLVADALLTILEHIGGFVDDAIRVVLDFLLNLVGTFAEYIPRFIQAGSDLILGFLNGLTEEIPVIIQGMNDFTITLITTMADTIDQNGYMFVDAIMRVMGEVVELVVTAGLSVIEALFSWIPGISEVTEAIGTAAGKYIEDNFRAFEIGDGKGKEFAEGITNSSGNSRDAGAKIAQSGVDGTESVSAVSSGEWFGSGFARGIASKSNSVWDAARNLASDAYNAIVSRLDINSPSLEAHALGEFTGQGYANGVTATRPSVIESFLGWADGMSSTTKNISKDASKQGSAIGQSATAGVSKGLKKGSSSAKKKAKKTAKDIANEAMSAFREKMDELEFQFEIGKIDTKKHIEGIKKLGKAYAKYPRIVHEANKAVKKIEDDARKDAFDKSKDYIEHKKYYNKMNLEEELKAWERIRDANKKGTEERKQADREVYRLKKELVEQEKRLLKEALDKSKAWIDDRKYYNEMSLKSELEAWERIQARYKKGTEERKEADKEVYRLKKEMYQAMTDLNEEYFNKIKETNQKLIDDEKALNKEYEDELKSRTDSIRSGLGGIFSEFKIDSEISGTKLLDNLRSQLNGMMNWSRQLKELAAKGIDEGLLEELRQMGPSAASEIAALTKMSSIELAEYSSVWRATNELARHEAVGELEDMRIDIDGQIEELHKKSAEQLDEYKDEWLKKMREIREGTPDEFDGLDATMESIGHDSMKGLLNGLKKMEGPLVDQAKSIAKGISDTIGYVLGVELGSNSNITGAGSKAGKAVKDAMTNVLDNLKLSKEIRVKAVLDKIEDPNSDQLSTNPVKMRTSSLVPEVSYTNRMLSSINQPTLAPTSPPQNKTASNNSADIKSLTAAIAGLIDKPQVTQLIVDGRQMAEVVGGRQYKTGAIKTLMRG